MEHWLFLILIATTGGIAITLQGQFVGTLGRAMGTIESVFITYGSGAVVVGLVMLFLRGGNLNRWDNVPGYNWTAGVLGLVIIGSISYCVPRLGLVATFTILIASQLIVGATLDHFGLLGAAIRPFDGLRLLGVAVLIVGAWLIIR